MVVSLYCLDVAGFPSHWKDAGCLSKLQMNDDTLCPIGWLFCFVLCCRLQIDCRVISGRDGKEYQGDHLVPLVILPVLRVLLEGLRIRVVTTVRILFSSTC